MVCLACTLSEISDLNSFMFGVSEASKMPGEPYSMPEVISLFSARCWQPGRGSA